MPLYRSGFAIVPASIVVALLMMLAVARAEEPSVTIGPGIMTFDEIAQKLSTQGHQVQCVYSLKDSAALVYIKQRTWKKACDLLSAGLDIEIVPDPIPASGN